MSKDLQDFAAYFMHGLQLGGTWADKWEERQIQQAHNELMAKQNAARENRENRRLDLYGQTVAANVELAHARAHKAMQPPRGAGGGAATPGASAFSDQLTQEAADRGIVPKYNPAPPSTAPANVNVEVESPDPGVVNPPASEEVPTGSKGGMIRKMARGGRVPEPMIDSGTSGPGSGYGFRAAPPANSYRRGR